MSKDHLENEERLLDLDRVQHLVVTHKQLTETLKTKLEFIKVKKEMEG